MKISKLVIHIQTRYPNKGEGKFGPTRKKSPKESNIYNQETEVILNCGKNACLTVEEIDESLQNAFTLLQQTCPKSFANNAFSERNIVESLLLAQPKPTLEKEVSVGPALPLSTLIFILNHKTNPDMCDKKLPLHYT